jgi:hypothetical protein
MLAAASQTNSATRTANLDCIGADYATIIINMASALNTNAIGPVVQILESDNTTASNFATFNSNANLTAHSIVNAHNLIFHCDLKSRKRYLRLSLVTATATNDNVTSGTIGILSRVEQPAAAASNNLGSTNDVVAVI